MSKPPSKGSLSFEKPGRYRIDVAGRLDPSWSDRLAGMQMAITRAGDGAQVTTLVGHLRDQAQLSGALNCLYDLHLPILLVQYLQNENG